jgi:predicted phosphoadenosine phosphosulfate sulfurtransferase
MSYIKMPIVKYKDKNVLEASRDRINFIFNNFSNIYVSVSSGKDSSVLFYLCLEESLKRNRKINLFFLDQEAEYENTVTIIKQFMKHPMVIPYWYQVPIYMTNATSHYEDQLYAWEEGKKWMRDKDKIAIKKIRGKYPKRFYKFFDWFEDNQPSNSAFLVGLRSKESINRFRAISKKPGYKDINWSTKIRKEGSYKFYPIYDWMFGDIWKYIKDNSIKYNKIYDLMFKLKKINMNKFRISNLIHEKSFQCLSDLQVLEPETYNKLIKRLKGVHCAALYSGEKQIYSIKKLPDNFNTWIDYRNSLLNTLPDKVKKRFMERFIKYSEEDFIIKQQIKQILLNDYENNIPIIKDKTRTKKYLYERYWDLL